VVKNGALSEHQDPAPRWKAGEVVVRREVLNDGRVWLELPVIVVQDDPGLLAAYIAEGAPLRFPPGDWPTADGHHPWHAHTSWEAHGVLMLQRPREAYSVWVFWSGSEREFDAWYINLQEPFRRTATGYDTQDLELDIVVSADLSWRLKDDEVMEQRVREGRFTRDQVAAVRAEAKRVTDDLDAGRKWWSDDWARWRPDPTWPEPTFP
jgi:hypothetical protein